MNWAIVLAGGSSQRMGGGVNKLYMTVAGRPLLCRTLRAFEQSGVIDGVVLVYRDGEREQAQLCADGISLPVTLAVGGATRTQSVARGLGHVPEEADIIAVHDGARCMVTPDIIRTCIESAQIYGSGVAATAAVDTLRRTEGGLLYEAADRATTAVIQTPQCFFADLLREAYDDAVRHGTTATDDSLLVSHTGADVHVVMCPPGNIKITTQYDIDYLRAAAGDVRCGTGFDSHGFVSGRRLMLGGVHIPYEQGLAGHSDADALCHAVIDALAGAAGLPDIGSMFPDTDMQYKDADSAVLLMKVAEQVRQAGWEIANVDATVICDAPRIAPYREAICERLAAAMGMESLRVNVKGKTAEGLGRSDVLAAQAVCTLYGIIV